MMKDQRGTIPMTIVLVTNQFECARLIRAGRLLSDISRTELMAVNVNDDRYEPNPAALEHLFLVSKENDAEMKVHFVENPCKQIIKIIKYNKTVNVVSGMPGSQDSILYKIWQKFTSVRFFTVDSDGEISEVTDKRASVSAQ